MVIIHNKLNMLTFIKFYENYLYSNQWLTFKVF